MAPIAASRDSLSMATLESDIRATTFSVDVKDAAMVGTAAVSACGGTDAEDCFSLLGTAGTETEARFGFGANNGELLVAKAPVEKGAAAAEAAEAPHTPVGTIFRLAGDDRAVSALGLGVGSEEAMDVGGGAGTDLVENFVFPQAGLTAGLGSAPLLPPKPIVTSPLGLKV